MTKTRPAFVDSESIAPTDVEATTMRALVEHLAELQAGRAAIDAAEAATLALIVRIADAQAERAGAESSYEFPRQAAAAEIAVRLRETTGALRARMNDADTLVRMFPATNSALSQGRITRRHADVIRDIGINLPDETRAEFERRSIRIAEESSPRRLQKMAAALADSLEPGVRDERHAKARTGRGVWVRDIADGMAELRICDGAESIYGIHNRLTEMARLVKADAQAARRGTDRTGEDTASAHGMSDGGAYNAFGIRIDADGNVVDADGYARHPDAARQDAAQHEPLDGELGAHRPVAPVDDRSLDQLRADLATDLLLGGAPSAHALEGDCEDGRLGRIRATVQVVIPVEALAGLGDDGAFLAGYGPLHPDVARRFAKDAPGWERVFQDPRTGAIETVDHYVPTTAIRRLVEIRDETCRFPHCGQSAARCDKDHTIEYSRGGPTAHGNLACLCRTHHMIRHHTAWTPEQSEPGVIVWTSPLGARYETLPPPQALHRALTEAESPPF